MLKKLILLFVTIDGFLTSSYIENKIKPNIIILFLEFK